ncbi:unnamed protein product [Lactuca saligna]|uniref:Reverse transcriptase zinc-binding domain-containing protein n=1 Tax=Lactuca saligna TaxID=75948 RepID=A0AA35Y6P1_LACSI|nr:unnamed protein product [Lactuca saligna]
MVQCSFQSKKKRILLGSIVNQKNHLAKDNRDFCSLFSQSPEVQGNTLKWNLEAPGEYTRLPTRENLSKIRIRFSSTCPLCNNAGETEAHHLIDCAISQEVWIAVKKWCLGLGQVQETIMLIYICVWSGNSDTIYYTQAFPIHIGTLQMKYKQKRTTTSSSFWGLLAASSSFSAPHCWFILYISSLPRSLCLPVGRSIMFKIFTVKHK